MVFFAYSYDNEQDLYPSIQYQGCNTTHVTRSGTIIPIFHDHCLACHSTAISQGGVDLESYTGVSVVAGNGRLFGGVNWSSGFFIMPYVRDKLSDCNLKKILIWIQSGFSENLLS